MLTGQVPTREFGVALTSDSLRRQLDFARSEARHVADSELRRALEARASRFDVREDSECCACRKRIGTAAFAQLTSGELAHVGCHNINNT